MTGPGFLNRFRSLRAQLAIIVAAALAPAGALAIVQALEGVERAAERRAAVLEAATLEAVHEERTGLIGIKQSIRSTAAAVEVEYGMTGDCSRTIASAKAEGEWMTRFVLLGPDGGSICGAETPVSLGDDPVWASFQKSPVYQYGSARKGRLSGKRILMAVAPMPNRAIGAVAVAVGVDVAYLERIAKPKPGEPIFALLGRGGDVITVGASAGAPAWKAGDPVPWLPKDRSGLTKFGDRRIDGRDSTGAPRLFFTSALEPGQIWAVTSQTSPSRLEVAFGPEGVGVLGPIAIWIIAVIVVYFAIDLLVTRHIGTLRKAAVRIGRGDLETPVGDFTDAPNEIRALGGSIQSMADRIANRETRLQETLEVQRRLLLEVHHRVQNNLQTISSFMNIEKRRVAEAASSRSLRVVQDRIHALAMVHQNLHLVDDLEEVELGQVARDIGGHLRGSVAGKGGRAASISFDLAQTAVDTVVATPVALFLTEAITDALEHGDRADPAVEVTLRRSDEGFTISVSNRLAAGEAADADGGLGDRLMKGFARQIRGVLRKEADGDRMTLTLTAPYRVAPSLFSVRRAAE